MKLIHLSKKYLIYHLKLKKNMRKIIDAYVQNQGAKTESNIFWAEYRMNQNKLEFGLTKDTFSLILLLIFLFNT